MNGMDKVNESLERIFRVISLGYGYQEQVALLTSWCVQWDENPEYDSYITSEVELFAKENMLFLIPKDDKMTKPIKVIIA